LDTTTEKELTLRSVVAIYRKRRSIILGIALLVTVAAVLYCIFSTRRYEAVGVLQVQRESSDSLDLQDIMSAASSAGGGLEENITLQTQAGILQSDTLALRTIEDLHLENTYDYSERWNPIRPIIKLLSPAGPADPAGANLENAPRRRYRVLEVWDKRLAVKPVAGTRLIEVHFENPDPQLSAAVVNRLMQSLSDYNFQTRYDATNQASVWLNDQLGDLRTQTQGLQKKVSDLMRESGVYSLGITDAQGKVQAYSAILDQLQQSTMALQQAEQNRIVKGAIWKAAEAGDAEMLSSLAGNFAGPTGTGNNSLAVIQTLREQEASQASALKQLQAKFGPNYPQVAELHAGLASTQRAIRDEINRIKGRAESDYQIAAKAEEDIRNRRDLLKKQADALNDKAIEYTIALQDATNSSALYEDLLRRLKEAGIVAGLKSSNITIVDPGRPAAKPKVPNVPLYLALAVGGGLLLGGGAGLIVDALDNKIHAISDIEEFLGQKVLGATPQYTVSPSDTRTDLPAAMALREPQSTYTEAIRAIRTSVLLSRGDRAPKVILVTSSVAGEGKTVFSSNFAAVLALQGQRVLIVDTDMRRGTLRQQLALQGGIGLSALLSGLITEPPIQKVAGVATLDAISGGVEPPNPAELLGSETMKRWLDTWRQQYDLVVLDGTPVLPVTDAVILDSLADVTILLARSKKTERTQIERSYHMLATRGRHYVGVVLNGIDPRDRSYYGYYGYYGYRKKAYSEEGGRDDES
jgi:polysaccharide biosynthesis transport protein